MRVRDPEIEHLDEETVTSNPFVQRGRRLVIGIDLDKMEERSFYVESMRVVVEIGDQRPQQSPTIPVTQFIAFNG